MDKKSMVMYLGYLAIILLGIYFTVGFLRIGGEGLASLGYSSIIEGMTDEESSERQRLASEKYACSMQDKFEKNINKTIETKQKALDKLNLEMEDGDYTDKLQELQSIDKEIFAKTVMKGLSKGKNFDTSEVVGAIYQAAMLAPLGAFSYISDKAESALDY
jgi:hypothetical protein